MNQQTVTASAELSDSIVTGDFSTDLQTVRSRLVNQALCVLAVLGLPALIASISRVADIGWHPVEYFYILLYLATLGTIIFIKRLSYRLRTSVLIGVLFLLGIGGLSSFGLAANGILILAASSILTSALFGKRSGLIATGISLFIIGIIGVCVFTGIKAFAFDINIFVTSLSSWVTAFTTFVYLVGITVISTGSIQKHLIQVLMELHKHKNQLEDLVRERTIELSEANTKLQQEVDERKQAEAALRASESRYRTFFEKGPDGVVVLDTDTFQFIEFNDQVCRQLGYSREEFAKLRFSDIEVKESEKETRAHAKKIMDRGYEDFETLQRTKQGEVRHVYVTAQVIDIEGRSVFHCIWDDITERRRMEDALRESEAKYRNLFDNAQVALFRTSIGDGSLLEINERYATLAGYESVEECKAEFHPGASWADPKHRDQMMKRLRRNGSVRDYETEVLRRDGIHHWFNLSATIYPEKGYLEGSMEDITPRRRAEQSLRESEQRLRQLADNMADVVWTADLDLNLTYVSPSIERLTEISADQYIKRKLEEKVSPSSLLKLKSTVEEELEKEKSPDVDKNRTRIIEVEERKADGSFFWTSMHWSFIRDDNGNITGFQGVTRDISDIKQYEAALLRREAILGAVTYEAEEFIRSFSLEKETIEEVLSRLGKAAEVSRVYIFENHTDKDGTLMTRPLFEWVSHGIASQVDNREPGDLPYESGFGRWVEVMAGGKTIYGHVKDFPLEERDTLYLQDIKSILVAPVFVGQIWWGFIGFDQCQEEREWLHMEIDGLRTAASILGLAIERKRAEEKVVSSLKEKDVLLREIHHRVKNNMQVTSSLLRLQARQINDPKVVEIFKESENRIRAMALIHDRLYRSEDLASIRFKEYVETLVRDQLMSYGVNINDISVHLEIEDISLGIDVATPSGMIINELLTNSLKYAFPKGRKGEITLSLRTLNDGRYELMVKDDGIGLPEHVDQGHTTSFGLYLVRLLVEKQLEGRMEIFRKKGTGYRIRFDAPEYSV